VRRDGVVGEGLAGAVAVDEGGAEALVDLAGGEDDEGGGDGGVGGLARADAPGRDGDEDQRGERRQREMPPRRADLLRAGGRACSATASGQRPRDFSAARKTQVLARTARLATSAATP